MPVMCQTGIPAGRGQTVLAAHNRQSGMGLGNYSVILYGFQDSDDGLRELLYQCPRVARIIDCGSDPELAGTEINRSMFSVFLVNASLSGEMIRRLIPRLAPLWRRGVLVGAHRMELDLLARQNNCFAEYMVPPVTAERLEKMFIRFHALKNQWLGYKY